MIQPERPASVSGLSSVEGATLPLHHPVDEGQRPDLRTLSLPGLPRQPVPRKYTYAFAAWGCVVLALLGLGLAGLAVRSPSLVALVGYGVPSIVGLSLCVAATVCLLAGAFLMLAAQHTAQAIPVACFLFLAGLLVGAGATLVALWPLGLCLLLVSALCVGWYVRRRPHIPLAAELLRHGTGFLGMYHPVVWVTVAFLLLQWFLFLLLAGAVGFITHGASHVLWPVFGLMYWWAAEVPRYLLFTLCCSLAAAQCYHRSGDSARPLGAALHRTAASAGFVVFGTVGVWATSSNTAPRCASPACAVSCCACSCRRLRRWDETVQRHFHELAFVHVALLGKTFSEAAHDVWRALDLDRPLVEAEMLRDFLVHSTMYVAILLALLAGFATNSGVLAVGAFLLTRALLATGLALPAAFSATTLVCFIEDPSPVRAYSPTLYDALGEASLAAQGIGPPQSPRRPSDESTRSQGSQGKEGGEQPGGPTRPTGGEGPSPHTPGDTLPHLYPVPAPDLDTSDNNSNLHFTKL